MMYAKGNDFLKDFVKRTKHNLERIGDGPYEVTQLINSMVGLLIFPKEKQFDGIADSLIDAKLIDKMRECIEENTYTSNNEIINLKQICRHLRNAIAHSNVEFEAEKPNNISEPLIINTVRFTDINIHDKKQKIIINVEVDLLKEFLLAFSDAAANLP